MYRAQETLQHVIKAWWKVAWQKAGKTLPVFLESWKTKLMFPSGTDIKCILVQSGISHLSQTAYNVPQPTPNKNEKDAMTHHALDLQYFNEI